MGSEHRRAPRAERGLLIRYRLAHQPGTAWLLSPLRDVSRGGARFISEQPFAAGDSLHVQLVLPMAPQPMHLTARVAWVKPLPERLTELGISFDELDASGRQALEEIVAQSVRKQER